MLFATINTSRSHLAPWVPWAIDGHRTLAQTTAYIVEQAMAIERASNDPERFRGIGLGVFERATGRLVGGTGIHDVQPAAWSCETGYWMRRESCGLGYATEVCAATISWALRPVEKLGLGLQRVRAICSSANTASVRVLDKLGLPRELCQRREYHLPGIGLTDRLGYGVHVDEWDTERHTMR